MVTEQILDALKLLSEKVDDLQYKRVITPNRSDDLKELFTALAKAQGEMKIAGLDSENPYFKNKYADLTSIIKASRPALAKCNLSVIQQILTNEDGANFLATLLCHSSGQWIESRMRIVPPKNDIQTLGSYLTYLARYSYARLICVAIGDEDDDGEIAVSTQRETFAKGPALNTKYNPRDQNMETVTPEQLEELNYELAEWPDIAEQVLDGLKIMSLADLPRNKYMISLQRIREIKLSRSKSSTGK